jgi:hypothetical protein
MVVDAVIDDDTASAPTMVTAYVPFAALGVLTGGGEEELPPPLEQPKAPRPIATKMHAAATMASLGERWRPTNPNKSSPAMAMLISIACSAENGRSLFPGLIGPLPKPLCLLPVDPATAGAGHDEATVKTVNVALTALLPDTLAFGIEKQPFVRAGLLDTVQAIVPV